MGSHVTASSAAPQLLPIPSFLGVPIGEVEDVRPGDICLVGLFFDHADGIGFGARFAARQLRYASNAAYGLCSEREMSGGQFPRCHDLGDLNVFPLEPLRLREALIRQARAVFEARGRLVVIGGAMDLKEILQAAYTAVWPDRFLALHTIGGRERHAVPQEEAEALAVNVDLSSLYCPPRFPGRPKKQLLDAIAGLPVNRIDAVHLTGFAPALDLSGRYETALALHVLRAVVARLQCAEDECR